MQFNSLAPGEEIQKAIEDRKRLADKLKDLSDQLRHKGTPSKFTDPVRGQATPLHSLRRRLPRQRQAVKSLLGKSRSSIERYEGGIIHIPKAIEMALKLIETQERK